MDQERSDANFGWPEKVIVALSAVPISLSFTAVSPVLPKLQTVFADYPNAPMLVKLLVGVIGISMLIGCPAGGFLATRFDKRMILVLASVGTVAFGTAGLYVSDLYVLLGTRFGLAFSAAVIATVGLVLLSERVGGNVRDWWMGIVVSVSQLGAMVGFPLAGYLGNLSWRAPFAMYFAAVPVLVASIFMHSAGKPRFETAVETDTAVGLPYRLMCLGFVCGAVGFLPTVYIPFHFREIGVENPQALSWGLTLSTLTSTIVASFYGRIRQKLDISRFLVISFIVTAGGLVVVALSPTFGFSMFGMFIFGAGLANLAPNLFALVAQTPERVRARTFGLAKGLMYLSSLVGVIALEPLDHLFGPSGPIIAVAVSGILMTAYILVFDQSGFMDRARVSSLPI